VKVVLVITSLAAGGAERIIASLAKHWAEQGNEVTLITFDGDKPYYPVDSRVEFRQLDLESHSRPLTRAVSSTLRRVRALRAVLRSKQPDIVISFLGKINIITLLATRGLGMPVVVSERNNPDRQVFRPVWQRLRKTLYGLAECVVTPSQGVLDWFPEKIRKSGLVIPNPVDLPEQMPVRTPGPKAFIAVGRLVHQKGFDMLLAAFGKIAGDCPDWNLVIRGEGDRREEIEHLCDTLNLRDRVQLPGITEKPGQWVDEGEIFVLSSRYESFGNVLTEAMVAGLPIVAFDCPWGPGEILTADVDSILLPPEDVDALADAMLRLVRDVELRQRLGRAAQENVRRFERSQIMTHWDKLVSRLIDQPR